MGFSHPLSGARVLIVLVAIGSHAGLVLAQDAPQPPSVRSVIDVVSVDVSVTGDGGKPVTGLAAGDFVVTVDGRPRLITSAAFVSTAQDPKADAPAGYSTNTGGGRLILLLVDLSALRGRASLEATSRFLEKLRSSDRIGLVAFPGAGVEIDFTEDHASVRTALSRLAGQAETMPSNFRIDLAEALAAQRGDLMALNRIADRECVAMRPEEAAFCRNAVITEATALATSARQRTENILGVLRAVSGRLAGTPGPKTLVLLSEGLVIERLSDVAWLGSAAARAQLTIHAVQVDAGGVDSTSARETPKAGSDRALGREGLSIVTNATRGDVFAAVGGLDNAFARLSETLSGYYILSFEPESIDRDGSPHRIKVDVPGRTDLHIRARSEFTITRAGAKTDETLLTELLKSPALVSDIGLKLAAFTLRDEESAKRRVLMVVEIDRAANMDGRLALAFVLSDTKGKVLGSRIDQDAKGPIRQADKTQAYSNVVLTDAPGPLLLKVAVVDDQGRRGSVQHRFPASLTTVGEFQAGDLLLADDRASGESAAPRIAGEFTSGVVNGYLELYSDVPDALKTATVTFEVAQNEEGRALDGAAGKMQPVGERPNRRAIEGMIPTSLLPPGDYVIRAVVSASGRRIGQVVRPFKVGRVLTAAKPRSTALTTLGRRPTTIVPFASRTEKFDRGSVLTPQVVGFFMERMNFNPEAEPNAASIVEHARAGRFDDAVRALSTQTGTLAAAFLGGLELYSKGQFEPAAAKFREALRLDSEFFPAAFYLGSCYAAGGRDDQAIGAWHLSLVTESEAPFIYTLLADALIREKNATQALALLEDAARQWPENDEVQVRIGTALAASGKRADALLKLEPFLDKHPDDHDRLLAAMRMLYEAKNERRPVRSTNEDRALFEKWAAAYAAANGPQQAVVDQWRRAFSR